MTQRLSLNRRMKITKDLVDKKMENYETYLKNITKMSKKKLWTSSLGPEASFYIEWTPKKNKRPTSAHIKIKVRVHHTVRKETLLVFHLRLTEGDTQQRQKGSTLTKKSIKKAKNTNPFIPLALLHIKNSLKKIEVVT